MFNECKILFRFDNSVQGMTYIICKEMKCDAEIVYY